MKKFILNASVALCLLTGASSITAAQEVLNETEVRKIVRDYLLENPEILLEVQQALETKQQQELADNQKLILEQQKDQIYSGAYDILIGDPKAEITIVEYFDYNCHFCQRAVTDMQIMMKNNSNLKFILKEFPVLGESSIEASRVSMAFSKIMPRDKHMEFHIELLSMHGQKDGSRAMQLALKMGADEQKLREEMENPKIVETIQETYNIANSLGISGTPSYILGNEVVFGAVGFDDLEGRISNLN